MDQMKHVAAKIIQPRLGQEHGSRCPRGHRRHCGDPGLDGRPLRGRRPQAAVPRQVQGTSPRPSLPFGRTRRLLSRFAAADDGVPAPEAHGALPAWPPEDCGQGGTVYKTNTQTQKSSGKGGQKQNILVRNKANQHRYQWISIESKTSKQDRTRAAI